MNPTDDDSAVQAASNQPIPETEAPDTSASVLEGVGQVKIAICWVVFIAFVVFGGMLSSSNETPVPICVCALFGIIILWKGYIDAAKEKATAKAAINATRSAERAKRIEQMLANMSGSGSGLADPANLIQCPSCGAEISASAKFCPECGAALLQTCAQCGATIPPSSKFCPECGANQQ